MEIMKNKERIISLVKLALSSFITVLLITLNIWVVSNKMYLFAVLTSFCISLCWTFNVKAIAIGQWYERLVYSFGAMLGTLVGLLLSGVIK
jgi:hypothetical protein